MGSTRLVRTRMCIENCIHWLIPCTELIPSTNIEPSDLNPLAAVHTLSTHARITVARVCNVRRGQRRQRRDCLQLRGLSVEPVESRRLSTTGRTLQGRFIRPDYGEELSAHRCTRYSNTSHSDGYQSRRSKRTILTLVTHNPDGPVTTPRQRINSVRTNVRV